LGYFFQSSGHTVRKAQCIALELTFLKHLTATVPLGGILAVILAVILVCILVCILAGILALILAASFEYKMCHNIIEKKGKIEKEIFNFSIQPVTVATRH
jgi:hypothetical protein